MNDDTTYFVFIRPLGSLTWTHHVFPGTQTPFRTGDMDKANHTAMAIAKAGKYCAIVAPTKLPVRTDECAVYALLADGDTNFIPAQ